MYVSCVFSVPAFISYLYFHYFLVLLPLSVFSLHICCLCLLRKLISTKTFIYDLYITYLIILTSILDNEPLDSVTENQNHKNMHTTICKVGGYIRGLNCIGERTKKKQRECMLSQIA